MSALTPDHETEIRERLAAATKGPWTHDDDDGVVNGPIYGTYISWESWPEDADFIAHARDDVPDLLAEVHRLRAELAKARAVTEDKVERAKRAFGAATAVTSSIPLGMSEHTFIQGVAIQHGYAIRIALQTALGGGDDA